MSDSLTPEELERFDKIIPLLTYGDKLVEAENRIAELEKQLAALGENYDAMAEDKEVEIIRLGCGMQQAWGENKLLREQLDDMRKRLEEK